LTGGTYSDILNLQKARATNVTETQLRIAYNVAVGISPEDAATSMHGDPFTNVLMEDQLCYDGYGEDHDYAKSDLLLRIQTEIDCLQRLRELVENDAVFTEADDDDSDEDQA
jgi:hypothetical protein